MGSRDTHTSISGPGQGAPFLSVEPTQHRSETWEKVGPDKKTDTLGGSGGPVGSERRESPGTVGSGVADVHRNLYSETLGFVSGVSTPFSVRREEVERDGDPSTPGGSWSGRPSLRRFSSGGGFNGPSSCYRCSWIPSPGTGPSSRSSGVGPVGTIARVTDGGRGHYRSSMSNLPVSGSPGSWSTGSLTHRS